MWRPGWGAVARKSPYMKWFAIPYDRRDQSGLALKYGVRVIPRLVAVDGGGNVVKDSDRDGRVEMLDELAGMF